MCNNCILDRNLNELLDSVETAARVGFKIERATLNVDQRKRDSEEDRAKASAIFKTAEMLWETWDYLIAVMAKQIHEDVQQFVKEWIVEQSGEEYEDEYLLPLNEIEPLENAPISVREHYVDAFFHWETDGEHLVITDVEV